MRRLFRIGVRFFLVIVIEALSVLATAAVLPGISLLPDPNENVLTSAVAVAIVLAIANSVIRPILLLLTLPISIRTVGLFTVVINALMLWLTSLLVPVFDVTTFIAALLGALFLGLVNTILSSLLIQEDNSFYDGFIQLLSRRKSFDDPNDSGGRGIVLLEIDGLSFQRMQTAVRRGLLPNVAQLLFSGTHRLSHYDCGLPSQTSSAQAGIMYGDNNDIPAFRWYLKDEGRMMVSNNFGDAYELNARYAHGRGLLRGGTSINNLMSGDARKSLLTMSLLSDAPDNVEKRSSEDLYLLLMNPYLFLRALLLMLADIGLELLQALRQRLRDEQPRINRLANAYPFLRGGSNVVLREISTYAVMMDIVRGSPAIYTTYFGYDEIAHHAGPDSSDALRSLKAIDHSIGRIIEVALRKAPRPYDLFILSDHGQSQGATFLQRYGHTLADLFDELVGAGSAVGELQALGEARGYTAAFLAELKNVQTLDAAGPVTTATLGRARESLQRQLERNGQPALMDKQVIVGVSGNLANVYFDLHGGKVTLPELEEAYPALIDQLIAHPGIGLVVSYAADGTPWVFGKSGGRDLVTGALLEQDPLPSYGDADFRAAQLLRLAQFPHAGDLILISTFYEDGTVAAFEEKIGSHGGLGGQQTDAFLLHPADMEMHATSNSAEIFPLIDARRGLLGHPLAPRQNLVDDWSPHLLWEGIRQVDVWLPLAGRALLLQRKAFHTVADSHLMTGPALLLALVVALGASLLGSAEGVMSDRPWMRIGIEMALRLASWVLFVLVMPAAARMLGGYGSGTRGYRTFAFAQVPLMLTWLQVVPVVGIAFEVAGFTLTLVALWLALQEAYRLRRALTLLLPPLYIVLVVLMFVAGYYVLGGIALTAEMLMQALGM